MSCDSTGSAVLRMHDGDYLRSCTASGDGIYVWIHPSEHNLEGVEDWLDGQSWIGVDLDDLTEDWSDEAYNFFVGEVDSLLDRAKLGDLSEDAYSMRIRHDACRIASQPGVAELRLRDPVTIGNTEYRARIYYSEPDCFDGLVSLMLHLKPRDSRDWRRIQNQAIAEAQTRGDRWVNDWRPH